MKWVYLALWTAAAFRDVPLLRRKNHVGETLLWAVLAGVGLGLGVWQFWVVGA